MGKLTFSGAVLYLSDNPDKVASQLAGETLTLAASGTLREDISTDEITPAASMTHFDERLAETVYTGFKSGDRIPFTLGDVRRGSVSVTVAGKRYGKGSSREQSPQSEQYAGIRLVIAESFERIYRQNADNIGLLTSTDFGLIARVQAGEDIDIEEIPSHGKRTKPQFSGALWPRASLARQSGYGRGERDRWQVGQFQRTRRASGDGRGDRWLTAV